MMKSFMAHVYRGISSRTSVMPLVLPVRTGGMQTLRSPSTLKQWNWSAAAAPCRYSVQLHSAGGGAVGGGVGGAPGEGRGAVLTRGPQSAQSVPRAQKEAADPGPPSSQRLPPAQVLVHKTVKPAGVEGGSEGGVLGLPPGH